jgi:3-methyladenine DNA glycosylase AlkD
MKIKEARQLGAQISNQVRAGSIEAAHALLSPVLNKRTPFDKLRIIGYPIGETPKEQSDAFIERIAGEKTEGGWVVIAAALEKRLERDMAGALHLCRKFIIAGDIWYCADILAEGVAGNALVINFEEALLKLDAWRNDENRWIRRAVGVSAHYWGKRSKGNQPRHAGHLLTFLEPLFYENQVEAVKGIGWGLKTIGRYYPDMLSDWLAHLLNKPERSYRALMVRKAVTYLPPERRAAIGL